MYVYIYENFDHEIYTKILITSTIMLLEIEVTKSLLQW